MNSTVRMSLVLLFCFTLPGFGQSDFTSDVKSAPYPWSHTRFLETNDNFHFAVVSDRNGGCRPGIFDDAVDKLNLLQPAFVMSVGDFIEGYTGDLCALRPQWAKVEGIIQNLQPPFFYVPGNHDYGAYNESQKVRDVRQKLWQELRGPSYYYFVYKNTLFICLNAMGVENHNWGLGEKQLAWAKEVLAKNPKVRWTFIFMHAPLWNYDASNSPEKKGTETPQSFIELEKTLKGRHYTVFAGHWHRYTYYNRQGMKYFVLATTGGGSELRGTTCGEFDHIMWVSMTDSGPKFINLMLSGMLSDNVYTETNRKFEESLRVIPGVSDEKTKKTDFTFTFKNTFDSPMTVAATWQNDFFWSIKPKMISGTVPPGQTFSQVFHVEFKGNSWAPLPRLACRFTAGTVHLEQDIKVPMNCFGAARARVSSITVHRAAQAPKIDGKLDEALWKRPATVDNLMYPDLSGISVPETQTWLAYDNENLYVAWRCEETDMNSLVAKVHDRDSNVWTDDCLEFFLDTNRDCKTYYQFDINSLGTVYDGTEIGDNGFNASVRVATSQDSTGWTVELAIPWKDLKISPPQTGTTMNYELVRIRPAKGNNQIITQFPPLGIAKNHQPELFGMLTFGQ